MAEKVDIIINGVDKASGVLKGITGAFGALATAGLAAAAAAGAAFGALMVDSIKAASDLAETANKINVVFGDAAGAINQFAASSATSLGQSKQAALDAAATFGVFGKSAGLTGGELSGFSTDLTGLAADLASFYNTSPEEAIVALGAALRGESEPIRRYGVLLDDASLRQKALEMGIISSTKNALTPQQRVLAANALIFEQTKDAQGDFMRTSDGLANSQRIITAQFANLKAQMGEAFLPVVQQLAGVVSTQLMPALGAFVTNVITPAAPVVQQLVDGFLGLLNGTTQLPPALQPLADAFNNLFSALQSSAPSTMGIFQQMWDFLQNTIATVGPSIVENLAGIINAITAIWTNHGDQVIAIVQFAWNAIVAIIGGALALVMGIINIALTFIGGYMDAWEMAMTGNWDAAWAILANTVATIWAIIQDTISAFMNSILGIVGTNLAAFNAVWSNNFEMARAILQHIIDTCVAILRAGISKFTQIGAQLIEGLWAGLRSRVAAVMEWLKETYKQIIALTEAIFDTHSPSRVFANIGSNLMAGMAQGIEQGADQPMMEMARASSSVTNISNYTLTINEAGSRGNVVNDFGLLKAMAGA